MVAAPDVDAWGLEPSAIWAEATASRLGSRVWARRVEEADLPSESCDVVFSDSVIEHLAEPVVMMKLAREVFRTAVCGLYHHAQRRCSGQPLSSTGVSVDGLAMLTLDRTVVWPLSRGLASRHGPYLCWRNVPGVRCVVCGCGTGGTNGARRDGGPPASSSRWCCRLFSCSGSSWAEGRPLTLC